MRKARFSRRASEDSLGAIRAVLRVRPMGRKQRAISQGACISPTSRPRSFAAVRFRWVDQTLQRAAVEVGHGIAEAVFNGGPCKSPGGAGPCNRKCRPSALARRTNLTDQQWGEA